MSAAERDVAYRIALGAIRLRWLRRSIPAASVWLAVLASPAFAEVPATIPRVLATTAQLTRNSPDIVVPGEIEARYQSNVSFRVSGRISQRLVEIGQHVGADQVLARMEPEQQQADLRDAQAALASAKASAEQASLTFARQRELMKNRYTTQSVYDQAEQQLRTSQAQVENAQARLGTMKTQLTYTDLKAGVAGIVTARNAEIGQVVKQGDTVFTIAQDGDRDAVFNIYEGLLAKPPKSKQIRVVLIADRTVTTTAQVREISPIVDEKTGAVRLKATLDGQPQRMGLGAPILGIGNLEADPAITLPWSALFRWEGKPAVWVVDKDDTVSLRPITIESYVGRDMVLKDGVAPGDRVVTAGIQFLYPGRKVAVVEGAAR